VTEYVLKPAVEVQLAHAHRSDPSTFVGSRLALAHMGQRTRNRRSDDGSLIGREPLMHGGGASARPQVRVVTTSGRALDYGVKVNVGCVASLGTAARRLLPGSVRLP
jgi:hypothetical protein